MMSGRAPAAKSAAGSGRSGWGPIRFRGQAPRRREGRARRAPAPAQTHPRGRETGWGTCGWVVVVGVVGGSAGVEGWSCWVTRGTTGGAGGGGGGGGGVATVSRETM